MSAPMILAESEVERIIRLSRNAEFARAYLEKGIRVPTFPESSRNIPASPMLRRCGRSYAPACRA